MSQLTSPAAGTITNKPISGLTETEVNSHSAAKAAATNDSP